MLPKLATCSARRSEFLSYLFFGALIATTFLV